MLRLFKIVVPNVMQEGFSAFISSTSATTNKQFTGWSNSSPYFTNPNFNASTGVYTVPATGRYLVEATINYSTSALTAQTGAGINPYLTVSSSTATILNGLLPVLDVSIALLISIRALLGAGTVTLAGEASLSAGNTLGLYYNADSMTGVTLNFSNVVWSVNRIT